MLNFLVFIVVAATVNENQLHVFCPASAIPDRGGKEEARGPGLCSTKTQGAALSAKALVGQGKNESEDRDVTASAPQAEIKTSILPQELGYLKNVSNQGFCD